VKLTTLAAEALTSDEHKLQYRLVSKLPAPE